MISIKIIYEDNDLLVVDKPAEISVFSETPQEEKTLIDYLIEKFPELKRNKPPRYGIAHRLDKDTSGALLVARTDQVLFFLQKQFKNRTIQKGYIALVSGNIKEDKGIIETLIGRSPKDGKKQKVFFVGEPGYQNKRQAITEYKVKERFNNYTLLDVFPKTGRKHQIRCHMNHIQHPIVGDKLYSFKGQKNPKGLTRHFLHAAYLKFKLPDGSMKEVKSDLPEDLQRIIKELR